MIDIAPRPAGMPENAALYFFGAVAIVILILIIIGVLWSWGGACKKCGSWKNWDEIQHGKDDHQPHLVFETPVTRCSACGHKEFIGPQRSYEREVSR